MLFQFSIPIQSSDFVQNMHMLFFFLFHSNLCFSCRKIPCLFSEKIRHILRIVVAVPYEL